MSAQRGAMAYVRWRYNVPAKRGQRVEYFGDNDGTGITKLPRLGRISYAADGRVFIKFDRGHESWHNRFNSKVEGPFHPTWKIVYVREGEPS